MTNKFTLALLAGLLLAGPAIAAGMWTNGSPQVPIVGTTTQPGNYPQMTGNELLPFDTGLPAGAYPQSAAVNAAQLVMLGAAIAGNTATATGTGATATATLSTRGGVITSGSVTTAPGATQVVTLTNTMVSASSVVQAAAYLGTSTAGSPQVTSIVAGAGSVVITVTNNGTAALNGTYKLVFWISQ